MNTSASDYEDYVAPAVIAAEKTAPFIGVYIAAASTVCSLLMLYDILHGSIKRQRWLPCKLFKLDAVTLALMAVVVKVTVDISDDMPRSFDQFSKLVGTATLCTYMCYIFPSVGDMKDATNMFALSILVITVLVNMFIQFAKSNVLHEFFYENIIMACFMLLLLLLLWHFFWTSKIRNKDSSYICNYKFIHGAYSGEDSFLRRLKICYLYGYAHNPQFQACKQMECGIVGDLSLMCLMIIIQGIARAILDDKSFYADYDPEDIEKSIYGKSMDGIVATQVVTVTIGAFASYFRRCTMTRYVGRDILNQKLMKKPQSLSNPIWMYTFFVVNATDIVFVRVIWASWLLLSLPIKVFIALKSIMVRFCVSAAVDESVKEFEDLYSYGFDKWLLRKSVGDMAKVIKESKRKSSDVCALLSEILPQPQSAGNTVSSPRDQGRSPRELIESHETEGIRKRLLSMVVLVRIVEIAIPESSSRNRMVKTFKEAFETLHFIEKHTYKTSFEKYNETDVAKTLWMIGDFSHLLATTSRGNDPSDGIQLDHAIHVIRCAERMLLSDGIKVQLGGFRDLVWRRTFYSVEELWCFMEDLFVDMLDQMLAQLPEAIFIAVSGSAVDEFQERVQESLKHLCKFESWDGVHRWKPPKACNYCSDIVTPTVLSTGEQEHSLHVGDQLKHNMMANVTEMLLPMDHSEELHLLGSPEAMEMPRNNDHENDVSQDTSTVSQNEGNSWNGGNGIICPEEHLVRITNDNDSIAEVQRI